MVKSDEKVMHFSKLFNEKYYHVGDKVVFESGVEYTKGEMEVLGWLEPETRKYVHDCKKIMPGTLMGEKRKDIFE